MTGQPQAYENHVTAELMGPRAPGGAGPAPTSRLGYQSNRVFVNWGLDHRAPSGELCVKPVAGAGQEVGVDAQQILPIGLHLTDIAVRTSQPFDVRQNGRQLVRHRDPRLDEAREFAQLCERDRSLKFGHPCVHARQRMVLRARTNSVLHTLVDPGPDAHGQASIVHQDEATLSGGDVLRLLGAEAAGRAEGADREIRVRAS